MSPVCVGDDGVEVCYCGVDIGNWDEVEGKKFLFCLLRENGQFALL